MYPLHTRNSIFGGLLGCAIIGSGSMAFAQGGLPVRIDSPDGSRGFGNQVASGGDLTLDGLPDVVVLDHLWEDAQGDNFGALFAYRGFDGLFLWKVEGLVEANPLVGPRVNLIGDVNNDGLTDVVVGLPWASPNGQENAGQLTVYSGADGELLYQISGTEAGAFLGRDIEPVGDITGDDVPDFAAVTRHQLDGMVTLFHGDSGEVIRDIHVKWPRRIANIGDINDDHSAEILIGEWGFGDGYGASLVSAVDGQTLAHFFEPDTKNYGFEVAGGGDLNGDDYLDFLISNSELFSSSVFVYSGADGELLQEISNANRTIPNDIAIGDIDGDGSNEIFYGQNNSFYEIFHLGDTTPFRIYESASNGRGIYGRQQALADLNGDSRLDFIFGAPEIPWVQFGAGSGLTLGKANRINFRPAVLRRGSPRRDNSYTVAGATASNRVWLLYSVDGKGCTFFPQLGICIDLSRKINILAATKADAEGNAEFSFPIPNNAPLNQTVWFQAVQIKHDVFGPVTSNVMEGLVTD